MIVANKPLLDTNVVMFVGNDLVPRVCNDRRLGQVIWIAVASPEHDLYQVRAGGSIVSAVDEMALE